jgi:amino acid transporter
MNSQLWRTSRLDEVFGDLESGAIRPVDIAWAMPRDERFPGWQQWSQISPRFHTPFKATILFVILAELILAIFSKSETALFTPEKPILVVAVVWLVFELALFRDASFKDAWLYVIVMVVIGACYLGYLLAKRGRDGLAMPDQHSIDAVLDQEAGTRRP